MEVFRKKNVLARSGWEVLLVVFHHPFQRPCPLSRRYPGMFPKNSQKNPKKFPNLYPKILSMTWIYSFLPWALPWASPNYSSSTRYTFSINLTITSWALPLGRYDLHPITDFTYATEEVCFFFFFGLSTLRDKTLTGGAFLSHLHDYSDFRLMCDTKYV